MCLLVLAWRYHARYRLVLAANRDEFHDRDAAPLARWPAPADIIAGRDLRSGGTWLGIDRRRRFGVVTNYRELQPPLPAAPSRGALIPAYLAGCSAEAAAAAGPAEFFAGLEEPARRYSGFNLLLGAADSLWYGSNRSAPFARALPPGLYGLANESLDTPWPKLERVRAGLQMWLHGGAAAGTEGLFALLADRTEAQLAQDTSTGGLPRAWARALSAPFVLHPQYGTRCSTVLLIESGGGVHMIERRFDRAGQVSGQSEFHLRPQEWP
ncbi:MAG TPA: NRDE family protein [Steroidobacteraceae bacterium]|nr:NRDE family protein [Steroidobacteraceae bacterium]